MRFELPPLCFLGFLEHLQDLWRANPAPADNAYTLLDDKGRSFWVLREREEGDDLERFWVWYKGNQIGSARIDWYDPSSIKLDDIRVDECYRRRGIGRALVTEIRRVTKEKGAVRLRALVDVKDTEREMRRLVRWYERQGFKVYGGAIAVLEF